MSDDEVAEAELVDEHGAPSESNTAALVPVSALPAHGALTAPIASVEEVRAAFEQYQTLRTTLITEADEMAIGKKKFVMKSGWRKLATVMGVSSEEHGRTYQRDAQHRIIEAEVVVRAIAPNGRFMDGLGLCDYRERCCPKAYSETAVCKNKARWHEHCTLECDGFNHFSKPQHDIPATAYTRALNRACSDLFGFGEVSAEEVTDRDEPAPDEWIARVVHTLNAIPNDEGMRTVVKTKFKEAFGMPSELKKGQMESVEISLRNGGFPIVSDISDAPAAATPAQGAAASSSNSGTGSETPEPPPDESASDGGEVGALSEAVTPPTSPPSSPAPAAKPSTAQQRQTLGMLWRDLEDKGLAHEGDKAEVCGIITQDRTTTTLEITFDEAVLFISGTRLIQQGVIEIVNDPSGVGRSIISDTTPGKQFLRKLPGGVIPQPA